MTTPTVTTPAVRVLVHDPRRNMWVVRHTAKSKSELDEVLRSIPVGKRVRLVETKTIKLTVVPAEPETEAKRHRLAQAARMSDLGDANKRYKSPG